MERESRKASDVLLDLEAKLDAALSTIRTQDLTMKIISNKLNLVIETLEKVNSAQPKVIVETVDQAPSLGSKHHSDREIPIKSEATMAVDNSPVGFRRNSRPETFAGDDSYFTDHTPEPSKYPVQLPSGANNPPPGRSVGESIIPNQASKIDTSKIPTGPQPVTNNTGNAIPVSQRVVNGHGKSLFLADVEVVDLSNMQTIHKTRTNGMGKWSASLNIGSYRIFIRKLDSASKERLEVKQDIAVDGQQSRLELKAVIVKP